MTGRKKEREMEKGITTSEERRVKLHGRGTSETWEGG